MPFVSEKFPSYTEFASASLIDIYGETKLEEGIALEANDFHSYVLWNNGGQFSMSQLPQLAQSAPISDIITLDANQDGNLDILFAGNDYNTEYETPRLDAGNGMLLSKMGNNYNRRIRYICTWRSQKNCSNQDSERITIHLC
ncbi:VCBS repeat-containing protein [Saprospiraceae bacterium]|nr:VCBS repeat-containing protein [Saprospiraceae bacterium]